MAQARRLQGTGGEQAFQARLQGGVHGVRQARSSLHPSPMQNVLMMA